MPRSYPRKRNPDFVQFNGSVHKQNLINFKVICAKKGISLSEGLDEAIRLWSEMKEEELNQKELNTIEQPNVSSTKDQAL